MMRRPRRTLLAGLACIAVAAVVPSVMFTGSSKPAPTRAVLAGVAGNFDTSFAGTGTVVQPGSNGATGVAEVPPGLTGAGGVVVSGGDGTHFQVARFTSTGLLDTSFGGGLTNAFLGGAQAVAVVPPGAPGAGDVVAVGYRNGSTCGAQFPTPVVAEFEPVHGTPVSTFGAGGVVALSCPVQGGKLYGVAVDALGNIYAAGEAFGTAGAGSMLVAGLTHSGTPIFPSFFSPAGGSQAQANAVAFAPLTGDVIAAGSSVAGGVGGTQHFTVAAFKAGALDPAFNSTGFETFGGSGGSAAGVAVLPNGNIVAAGGAGNRFLLAQVSRTGLPDATFSGGQVANTPNLSAVDTLTSVAYQPLGNIIAVAGFKTVGATTSMALAQYNATTGAPNLAFGSLGAVVRSYPFSSTLSAVTVDSTGKTIAAGSAPIVNAVQGIAALRVSGPTLSVANHAVVQVSSFDPVTVGFDVSISEPLFTPVAARLCSSPAGAVVAGQGGCADVTIPAGATRIIVPVKVTITTGPGQSQTMRLIAGSTNGLTASATQAAGSVVIQHLAPPQPYVGYRLVASDGGIFAFGTAPFEGSTGGVHLTQPIVGMAAVPHAKGYWLLARDGGIFAFGGAPFLGSTGAVHLTQPIVAMAATPDGRGYWLVASDGGIFAFGDAHFYGSTGGVHLTQPIVAMAATPDGRGYWLVARDGGIFAFGDAKFLGSTGGVPLTQPIVAMAAYPGAPGYWLVASDGGIFSFGASLFHGSTGGIHLTKPIVGMASTSDGKGYWLVASDGGIFAFGDARFFGSTGGIHLTKPIVGMSG